MTTIAKQQQIEAFGTICDDYWQLLLKFNPMEGLGHGHEESKTRFFREGLADLGQRSVFRTALAKRLRAIDPLALEGQMLTSYEMLDRQLKLDARFERLDEDLRPNFYPFGPEAVLQMTASTYQPTNLDDASSYVERLGSVRRAFGDFVERYEEGAAKGFRLPRVLFERALANVAAVYSGGVETSGFLNPLRGERFSKQREAAASLLEKDVFPALSDYRDSLERIYGKATRDSIAISDDPNGLELYCAQIERHTSLSYSPEEIHRIGIDELDRIQSELSAIAHDTGHSGNVAALRAAATSNPAFISKSDVELRERIEVLSKRIDAIIPSFFARVPRSTYGVRTIPPAMAANAPPAYAQPAPADRTAPGIHWITSLPDRCPSYMHVPLALHEAWPGHLMHIALIEEVEGLPAFRRFGAMHYTAYLEGWALYSESLGVDMGLYQDPYAHFGRLSMDAWRAVRLVIDTGIHALGWSRQRAVELLETHQAMGRAAAEAEVDRYIGMPAQALSYKLGHIAIRTLRSEAETQLGNQFSIRELHSQLIDGGAVPLAVLNSQVRQWIRSRAAV